MLVRRLMFALTLSVLLAVVGATPAQADSGVQIVEVARYFDKDGSLIRIFATNGYDAPTATQAVTSGCDAREGSVWATGVGGAVVWRLTQRVDWCWDGSAVTSYGRTVTTYWDASTYWKDLGINSDSVSSPITGAWQTVAYRKQTFAQCAWYGYWFCWDYRYPWLRTTVYGNGQYLIEGGA